MTRKEAGFFYYSRNNNTIEESCNESRNILARFEDSSRDANGGVFLNRYVFSFTDFENAIPCGETWE